LKCTKEKGKSIGKGKKKYKRRKKGIEEGKSAKEKVKKRIREGKKPKEKGKKLYEKEVTAPSKLHRHPLPKEKRKIYRRRRKVQKGRV
jgi:hypothetical protein